jgi:hypothetical protein
MDSETVVVRKPKRKIFTKGIHVLLRESQMVDLVTAGERFNMDISEMVRDAVSQWLGRQRADYPEMFSHREAK